MQEVQLKELNSIFFFFFLIKTISSFSYQVTNSHKFVSASSVLSVLSVLSSRLGMHPNCLFILVLSLSFSRPEQHRLQHGAPLHQSLPCIMPPCSSLLHLRRHHHHLIGDLSPSPILGFAVVRLHHIYGNVYGKMGFSRGDRVCLHSSEFTRLIVFENLALTFLFVLKSRAAARREKKKEKKERKKIKTKS